MRLGAILLALVVAGSLVGDGERLDVATVPVPLDPTQPDRVTVGDLGYRGGLWLQGSVDRFGGLSDVRITSDGQSLTAISDCGDVFTARLTYAPDGRLAGMEDVTMASLAGGALPPAKESRDAEGLVALPDKSWLVAFERQQRIAHFASGSPALQNLLDDIDLPSDMMEIAGTNSGIEGLALLADGRLLAVAEGAPLGATHTHLWLRDGPRWTTLDYPFETEGRIATPFRPTAAAGLPNGDALVLERRFPPLAARVRRLAASSLRPGGDLRGTEVARIAPPMTVDNFEGLDVVEGPGGETRVYVLSDDNGCHGRSPSPLPPQRTLLLMFVLRAGSSEGRATRASPPSRD